jgi:hypothetical protein
VTLCSGLAVTGSFKSGRSLSGTGIGALTNISFTGCKVEGAKTSSGGGPGFAGLDVKQFDRIDLGGFGDSIADSSVIVSPAQKISSP